MSGVVLKTISVSVKADTTMTLFYACCEDLTREGAWTVHVREVVNNWEKMGARVTLFAPRIWPFSVPPDCDVVYVPTVNVRFVREYLYLLILPLYIVLFGLRRRPAALYCREMSLMAPIVWAARLLGIPVLMEINGFLLGDLRMIGASRARRAFFRLLQQMSLAVADRIVFAGPSYLNRFREEYRMDERKVRLVPNGVDTLLFSPGSRAQAIRGLGLDAKKRYVTFVGTFYPHSLTPTIVRAALPVVTKYADIDFIMVGDGHDRAYCRGLAEQLGVSGRVHFPGMKNNSDIPAYIRASTVLVDILADGSASATMKLLEYMSAEGAVVGNCAAAFGVPLTHRKDYYRIDEATPEGLARAVEEVASDPSLAAQMGRNARKLVIDHFSWEKTARKLLLIIDEVAHRR
jgi:glycosyltransferase involved in cell wall biosynthesis